MCMKVGTYVDMRRQIHQHMPVIVMLLTEDLEESRASSNLNSIRD